jgi:purine-cytosine permease-like protein
MKRQASGSPARTMAGGNASNPARPRSLGGMFARSRFMRERGFVCDGRRAHTFSGPWPAHTAPGAMSVAQAITAIAGLFALGASVSSPDIQRFCKIGRDAILTGLISFGVAFFLHLICGAVCGLATGDSSISSAFAKLGAAISGFILLFILSWTVVHNDYYCASLCLASLLRAPRPLMAAISAICAAIIAAANVQNHLVQWLTLMSMIAIPLAGLIAADYIFRKKLWLTNSAVSSRTRRSFR